MRAVMTVTGLQASCRVCGAWTHLVGEPDGLMLLVGCWLAAHLDPVITDVDVTVGGVEMTWRLVG